MQYIPEKTDIAWLNLACFCIHIHIQYRISNTLAKILSFFLSLFLFLFSVSFISMLRITMSHFSADKLVSTDKDSTIDTKIGGTSNNEIDLANYKLEIYVRFISLTLSHIDFSLSIVIEKSFYFSTQYSKFLSSRSFLDWDVFSLVIFRFQFLVFFSSLLF